MIKNSLHLAIRRKEENPNHHLWLNNGTWWIYFTLKSTDGVTKRHRISLKTHHIERARDCRDRIIKDLQSKSVVV